MAFFSGLTANGLLGAVGRTARGGPQPLGGNGLVPAPVGRDMLDRLRLAMDPERLAIAQALLAGDHGVVARMTEPLRRRRLEKQASRERPFMLANERAAASADVESGPAPAQGPTWPNIPMRDVPEGLRARRVQLDSGLINHGRVAPSPGDGPWQFDTMNQLEAAFDDMAPREELVTIGKRGGVVDPRWLRELDNALTRRDADPEATLPFRNFVPESAMGRDAIMREAEAVRANRRRYREALRAKELDEAANRQPTAPPRVEGRFAGFFSQQDPYISEIARRRGIDPTLLLGLSAYESTWGESRMTLEQNNPFGATPSGDRSGGVRYPSFQEAWESWDRQWGARIDGLGTDEERFVDSLLQDNRSSTGGIDQRGAYNSETPSWRENVLDTIRSVRRRYPHWLKPKRFSKEPG